MQWIACTGYGRVTNIVTEGENAVLPLMTMPSFATIDPSGVEDDALEYDFVVLRIVGQVTIVGPPQTEDSVFLWGYRLMALPLDLETGGFDVPWSVTDTPLASPDISNAPRWWGERFRFDIVGAGEFAGLDPFSHPHWTFIDIEPKAICGPHVGYEYPCIVWDNVANPNPFIAYHRLRMLISSKERR